MLPGIPGLRAQPGFPAAFWIIIDRYLRIHSGSLITKLVVSDARYWVTQMIMAMHGEYVTGLLESRLTISALVRRAQALPVAGISRGQVVSLVGLMRARGRLLPAPGEEGRRDARLVPSAEMLREQIGRTALHLEAMDAIFPGRGHLARLRADPPFYFVMERVRGATLERWGNPLRHFPVLAGVIRYDACYTVLACLMLAAGGRPGMPRAGPCALPYGELAGRIGASRTQIRRAVELLEGAGLVRLAGRGGTAIDVTPALIDMLADFHALRLLRFDHMAQQAQKMKSDATTLETPKIRI